MKKEEFFARLYGSLTGLTNEERRQVGEYYTELFLDETEEGKGEEEVIAHFGIPELIAAELQEEQVQKRQMQENRKTVPVNHLDQAKSGLYQPRGEISAFQVFAQDIPIRIRSAQDDRFKIYYQKSPNEEITVKEVDGCYVFRHEIPLFSRIFSFWRIGKGGIIVEVPERKIREFQAVTCNASIKAEKITGFKTSRLYTSNAGIAVDGLRGESLECKTSNAGVQMRECAVGLSDIQTSNGRIACSRCKSRRGIRLKTSNAGVDIRQIECPDIWIKSSNGGLKGNVCGNVQEYEIDAGTSNASCNLPHQREGAYTKKLYAHTSNASIKIDFHF